MKKSLFFLRCIIIILIMISFLNIFKLVSFADSDLKIVNDSALTSRTYVNAGWAYLETIKLYQTSSINTDYCIIDINKDGNPELIIRSGSNDSNYNFHFYTFNISELKYLESVSGVHTILYEMEDEKYIYALYAHMNYEQVTLYGLNNNNKLVKKVYDARQLQDGEEHIGGDVKIDFVKTTDIDYLYNNIQDLTDETTETAETTESAVIEFNDPETTEETNEVNNTNTTTSFTNEINNQIESNENSNSVKENEVPKKISYAEYMSNRKQMIIYILIGVIVVLVLIIYFMSKSKKKKKE